MQSTGEEHDDEAAGGKRDEVAPMKESRVSDGENVSTAIWDPERFDFDAGNQEQCETNDCDGVESPGQEASHDECAESQIHEIEKKERIGNATAEVQHGGQHDEIKAQYHGWNETSFVLLSRDLGVGATGCPGGKDGVGNRRETQEQEEWEERYFHL